jgi:hypothetical protein
MSDVYFSQMNITLASFIRFMSCVIPLMYARYPNRYVNSISIDELTVRPFDAVLLPSIDTMKFPLALI